MCRYRETELKDDEDKESDSNKSKNDTNSQSTNDTTKMPNKGNFKELLGLLCIENQTLVKNIKRLLKMQQIYRMILY